LKYKQKPAIIGYPSGGSMNRRFFILGTICFSAKSESLLSICEIALKTVNSKLQYSSDLEKFGVVQYTDTVDNAYKNGFADCEEYSLCYRHELIKNGLDQSRIKLVYCSVRDTAAHVFCLVDNNFVLCCLMNSVRTLDQRHDLTPHRLFGEFVFYNGSSENELIHSINNNIVSKL
jgi:hypothetical protein